MKTIKQLLNKVLLQFNLHPSLYQYCVDGKYVSYSVYMQNKKN